MGERQETCVLARTIVVDLTRGLVRAYQSLACVCIAGFLRATPKGAVIQPVVRPALSAAPAVINGSAWIIFEEDRGRIKVVGSPQACTIWPVSSQTTACPEWTLSRKGPRQISAKGLAWVIISSVSCAKICQSGFRLSPVSRYYACCRKDNRHLHESSRRMLPSRLAIELRSRTAGGWTDAN